MNRLTASALAAGALLAAALPASASAADTAPIYHVTQEGLTRRPGRRAWPRRSASPTRSSPTARSPSPARRSAQVPLREVGTGKDESGRPIVSQAIDMRALAAIKPLDDAEALDRAGKLVDLAGLSPDFEADPSGLARQAHAVRPRRPADRARRRSTRRSPTAFELAGLPVSGQGAKLRITFAGDGSVTQLSRQLRRLERRRGRRRSSAADEAQTACAALYDRDVRQGDADARLLLPGRSAPSRRSTRSYTCNPVDRARHPGPSPGAGRRGRRTAGRREGVAQRRPDPRRG